MRSTWSLLVCKGVDTRFRGYDGVEWRFGSGLLRLARSGALAMTRGGAKGIWWQKFFAELFLKKRPLS